MQTVNCKIVYKTCKPIVACAGNLEIHTNIISQAVTVNIRDKFKNVFAFEMNTNTQGIVSVSLFDEVVNFVIVPSVLPKAYLNEFGSNYRIWITQGGVVKPFIDSQGKQYDELEFSAALEFPAPITTKLKI